MKSSYTFNTDGIVIKDSFTFNKKSNSVQNRIITQLEAEKEDEKRKENIKCLI